LAYPVNDSPQALLFRAFRRNDPGLQWLVPGDDSHAVHEAARQWGRAFHQDRSEFQTDEHWYQAAAEHDAVRQGRPRAPDE
jgi:hypothetical protein